MDTTCWWRLILSRTCFLVGLLRLFHLTLALFDNNLNKLHLLQNQPL
nr:MAG TPA: hypothetical protein [Caudoviricetes sp.]